MKFTYIFAALLLLCTLTFATTYYIFPNVITNGDFASSSNWSLTSAGGIGAPSISGGALHLSGWAGTSSANQYACTSDSPLKAGKTYNITFNYTQTGAAGNNCFEISTGQANSSCASSVNTATEKMISQQNAILYASPVSLTLTPVSDSPLCFDMSENSTGGDTQFHTYDITNLTATLASASAETTLDNALLTSWWKFDEISGTTAVDSFNAYNGTNSNITFNTNGIIGGAYNFNGTSSYVNFGNSDVFSIIGGRTFSAWIKTTSGDGNMAIVSKRYPASNDAGYSFYLNRGKLFFYAKEDTFPSNYLLLKATSYDLNDGQWHNVGFSYQNSSTVNIFVDGLGVNKTTIHAASPGTLGSLAGDLLIGKDEVTGTYFKGSIDEVSFWTELFVPTQAWAVYQGAVGLTYCPNYGYLATTCSLTNKNLLSWYRLDEIAGTTAKDSYNCYDLTPNTNVIYGTTGKVGKAYDYSSTGLSSNNRADNNFDNNNVFSAFAWVKTSGGASPTTIYPIVNKLPQGGYLLGMLNNKVTVKLKTDNLSNEILLSSLGSINDNQWHYVGFTYDGSGYYNGVKIYIDGYRYVANVYNADILSSTIKSVGPFWVGGNSISTAWPGLIDETAVYKTVVPSSQVISLWNYGSGMTVDGTGPGCFVPTPSNPNPPSSSGGGVIPTPPVVLPPVTTLSGVTNPTGWNDANQLITLTCASSGSVCVSTNYNLDGAGYVTYTAPFDVNGDLNHTITYYSTDAVGNTETTKTAYIAIDLVNPTVGQTKLNNFKTYTKTISGTSSLLNNIIAYYKLDTTASMVDEVYGINSTVSNVSPAVGKIDMAYLFLLSSSSQAYSDANTLIDIDRSDSFSVFAWIYCSNDAASKIVWAKQNPTPRGVSLRVNPDDTLGVRMLSDVGAGNFLGVDSAETGMCTGSWNYVGFTYDGTSLASGVTMYLNNTPLTNANIVDNLTGTIDAPTRGNKVGFDSFTYSDIAVDELGEWKRVLTTNELTALYNSGNGVTYPFTGVNAATSYLHYINKTGDVNGGIATDSLSGINQSSCEYSIDNQVNWNPATWFDANKNCQKTLSIVNDVNYTLNTRVRDNAGNLGTGIDTNSYIGDTTAPITTVSTYDVNTITHDININLVCFDYNASGCATTQYRINNGSWVYGSTIVPLSADGNYNIDFNSIDNVENSESIKSIFVIKTGDSLSSVEPTTILSGITNPNGWNDANQTITLTCVPFGGATCSATQYSIDNGAWQTYTGPFDLNSDLNHRIDYNSRDSGSVVEATKTSYCAIDRNVPTVGATTISGFDIFSTFIKGTGLITGGSVTNTLSGANTSTCQYTTDGNNWYTADWNTDHCDVNLLIFNGVSYTFNTKVQNNAGTYGLGTPTTTYVGDNLPPVTTAFGWSNLVYVTAFYPVALSCDDSNGSGCALTQYRLNDGNWVDLNYIDTNSVQITVDGNNKLDYNSIDNLGNKETMNTVYTLLDTTNPSIGATTLDGFIFNGDHIWGTGRVIGGVATDGIGIDTNTCQYTLDGLEFFAATWVTDHCESSDINIVSGQTYSFNTAVQDFATNQGIGTPTITYFGVNGIAPDINITGTTSYWSTISPQNIGIFASDPFGVPLIQYRLDNNVWISTFSQLIDQNQNENNSGTALYGSNWVSQTFIPDVYGITNISIQLKGIGTYGDLNVLLTTTLNGKPTTTILAKTTYSPAGLSAINWQQKDINLDMNFIPGTEYAVVFNSQTSDVNNYLLLGTGGNNYTDGNKVDSLDNGGTWTIDATHDLFFATDYNGFTITTDGNHKIDYNARGGDGNATLVYTAYSALDTTGPTILRDLNYNTWKDTDFNVETDVNFAFSGYALAKYTIDGSSLYDINYNLNDMNFKVPIVTDGNHVITYWFRDNAGNDTNIVRYALRNPILVTITITGDNNFWTNIIPQTIEFFASSLSGIISMIQYRIDSLIWITLPPQQYIIDQNIYDANITGGGFINWGTGPTDFYAQSFVPSYPLLSRFQFSLVSGTPGNAVTAYLEADNGNKPSGIPLSTRTISAATWDVGDVNIDFNTTVIPGNKYWVVLTTVQSANPKTNIVNIGGYYRGDIALSTDGITWTLSPTAESYFTTYYNNNVILISSDGNHQIDYNAVDNLGNTSGIQTAYSAIDVNGMKGWTYIDGNGLPWKNYDFNITAHDVNFYPAGKFLAKYNIDGGPFLDLLFTPDGNYYVTIVNDANHVVVFWFRDNGGIDTNIVLYALSDKNGPVIYYDANFGLPWKGADFNVRVDANFSPSGMFLAKYSIDGSLYNDFNFVINDSNHLVTKFLASITTDGNHTIAGWLRDNAGNDTNFIGQAYLDIVGPSVGATTVSGFTQYTTYIQGTGTIVGGIATDTESGLNTVTCEYTSDGATWLPATWNVNHCEKVGFGPVTNATVYTFNTRIKDNLGNQGTGTPIVLTGDLVGPTIGLTTVGGGLYISPNNLWIGGTGTIIGGLAVDTLSGVDTTTCEYRQNSVSPWLAGTWNVDHCQELAFPIVNLGSYSFNTRVKDNIGNQGTGTATSVYTGDTVLPTTTIAGTSLNWTTVNQTATLTPVDTESGVANTYYRLDLGGWNTYTVPVVISTDGNHQFDYYSVDNVNNTESTHTTFAAVDKTAPVVGATSISGFTTYTKADGNKYFKGTGTIVGGTATDATSGLNTSTCYYTDNNGATWAAAVWNTDHCEKLAYTGSAGLTYKFNTKINDNAGNTGYGTLIKYTFDINAPRTTPSSKTYLFDINVSLKCFDYNSGCQFIWYNLDSTGWIQKTGDFNWFIVTSTQDHNIQYYSVDNLGNAEDINSFITHGAGIVKINVKDENTGAVLTDVNIIFGGYTFNIPAGLTTTYDLNMYGITGNEFIFSKAGYGLRYYDFDGNIDKNYDINMLLLETGSGLYMPFTFYANDATTVISNGYATLIKNDFNNPIVSDSNGSYIIGRRATDALGNATIFVNKYDQNYDQNIMSSSGDINMSHPILLVVYYPLDEKTLNKIPRNWSFNSISNYFYQDLNLSTDLNIVNILPNTGNPYIFKIGDDNGIYYTRSYYEIYKGNPLIAYLQPYLITVADGSIIRYQAQNELGFTIPGILVNVYKTINNTKTLVQNGITDSAGEYSANLIPQDQYYYDLFINGHIITQPPFNLQTLEQKYYFIINTLSYYVSSASSLPIKVYWNPATQYLYGENRITENISGPTVDWVRVIMYQYSDSNASLRVNRYIQDYNCIQSCQISQLVSDMNQIGYNPNLTLYVDLNVYFDSNNNVQHFTKAYSQDLNAGGVNLLQLFTNAKRDFGCVADQGSFCPWTTLLSVLIAILVVGGLVYGVKIVNPFAQGAAAVLTIAFFTIVGWFFWVLIIPVAVVLIFGLFGRRGSE